MQYTNFHFILSTFFGLGKLSKKLPGTIGSIVAFPLTLYCFKLSKFFHKFFHFDNVIINALAWPLFFILLLFILGIISSSQYAKITKNSDPKEVIIDEIVGQMLCITLTIPISLFFYQTYFEKYTLDLWLMAVTLINFALFRLFDILKPWPISWVDKKCKGGFGIMFDDVVAAIFATIVYFIIFLNVLDYLK